MELDGLSWRDILVEKRELFEHLVPSFNFLVAAVTLSLSSKMEATSIDDVLDKIHEQLGMVEHIFNIYIYIYHYYYFFAHNLFSNLCRCFT